MPAADRNCAHLEIRIFPHDASAAGYPIELTLNGQQEFPRGTLSAGILPWRETANRAGDGRRLYDALLADPVLRSAWGEARDVRRSAAFS